jgi:hypothetical protein
VHVIGSVGVGLGGVEVAVLYGVAAAAEEVALSAAILGGLTYVLRREEEIAPSSNALASS